MKLTTAAGSVIEMDKETFFTPRGLGTFCGYLKAWHRHIVKAPNVQEGKRRMNQFRQSVTS